VGVADRGYMRGRGPAPIALGASWTFRFIVLLAVLFVAAKGAHGWFGWRGEGALLLSRDALAQGRVWTILTAAFLHADTMHLLFNLLGLWYFGKLVEESLGSGRYVAFFLLAAVASHLPFLAAQYAADGHAQTIGVSGVVMAALVFAAFRYPGMPFTLIFFPVVLWQLAVLYVALDVYGAAQGGGFVDHWTHLGGAAFGFLVHKYGLVPNLRMPRFAGKSAAPHHEPGPFRDRNVRDEIDRLLDKIAREGITSLSDEEREFLTRESGKYR
jgi:membrane associated rhomboid family serine protease